MLCTWTLTYQYASFILQHISKTEYEEWLFYKSKIMFCFLYFSLKGGTEPV